MKFLKRLREKTIQTRPGPPIAQTCRLLAIILLAFVDAGAPPPTASPLGRMKVATM